MPERFVTHATYEFLKRRKEDLEKQIREAGSESSGSQRASLHDDAGAENDQNVRRGMLLMIGDLENVAFIEPRQETSIILMGNKVKIALQDEEEEIITLLTKEDAMHRKDLGTVVSVDSPLGKAILGKKNGDVALLQFSATDKREIKIIDILPGDF